MNWKANTLMHPFDRTRKSFAVLLGTALISAGALSGPAHAETLQSALVSAYETSDLLEQSRALLRVEDESVAIALSALRPQINGSSTITQADQASNPGGGTLSSTISLGLELLLYDSGATALAVEATKETVLATRASLVNQEQQVLLSAVQAYVAVLRDARVVILRDNNLRLITQELRAARDRFEVGEVTRTDVAQAEARLAEGRGQLVDAQGQLEISRELYRATVGRAPGTLSGIRQLPSLPASADSARLTGVQNSPSIKQAQHQIKAQELNVERAKAALQPRISLSAGIGHSSTRDNNSSVGLTMNVPLYQGGQLKSLIRQARASLDASRYNLNQQTRLVRQNVSDSWSRLAVANAQVEASDRQIQAAEVAFNGVREEARLGARTTLDVLDAEQALLDARTNRVIAETQVYDAAYGLLSSMGLLTAEYLNLPVTRYDPTEYYKAVSGAPTAISPEGRKLDRILQRYQKN
ncbi:MAG: TolC family outer membrane protein [Pseudomonadota bacterium]